MLVLPEPLCWGGPLLQEAFPDLSPLSPLRVTPTPTGIDSPMEVPSFPCLSHSLDICTRVCTAEAQVSAHWLPCFRRDPGRQILILDLPLPGFETQFLHLENGNSYNAHLPVFA